MKRLCIYVTYDRERIIDEYIHYMLKELKTCVDYLVVVSNQTDIICGKEFLEEYADEIFYRENVGFDAGAYKDTLCEYLGWERVLEYDELILVNDSLYGPFVPMKTIFSKMDKKDIDFWALTKHKNNLHKYTLVHTFEHLQSFFIAIKRKMLHSEEFSKYWCNMPYYKEFSEVILNFELAFTHTFSEKGFAYDCYADMDSNDSENLENNFIQYILIPNELIRRRDFPFLKRKQISYDNIDIQTQENNRLAIEYIKEETVYDVRLIYRNLIRTMDISDLYKCLCLHYIVPSVAMSSSRYNNDVAIAVFIEHVESEEYILDYLERLKTNYHVLIFSTSQFLVNRYCELGYKSILYKLEKEALLFLAPYKYICIIHDEDMTSDIKPSYHGKALFFKKFENLIKNEVYVNNVINKFEQDEFLGILGVPESNFGEYFGKIGLGWENNYNQIYSCIKDSKLSQKVKAEVPPFAMFKDFWIRGSMVGELSNYTDECIAFLPCLWGYIAQVAGYYSGIVESDFYASMNTINKQKYLEKMCNDVRESLGDFSNYKEFKRLIRVQSLISYCNAHEEIYIFGAGDYANLYSGFVPNLKAYVVSDGRPKVDELNGKRILYLSEAEVHDRIGFVLCMDKNNQKQIKKMLLEKGITDFFSI